MTHPDIPEEIRGTLRRARPPGDDRAPDRASASPRSSSCRCTSSCTTDAARQGPVATTGATTRSASSRRTTPTARPGQRGQQVLEFKAMVRDAAPRRHRGDPRRRLQPHGRGQPPRARRWRSAASTTPSYYRLDRRRQVVLLRHDGHRQHAADAQPARAAADHGLAALLGDRDARRRLPLRPRGAASPGSSTRSTG